MMMTQNGKLLYISDNAAEYLGHSMVSGKEFYYFLKWKCDEMLVKGEMESINQVSAMDDLEIHDELIVRKCKWWLEIEKDPHTRAKWVRERERK